jgi:hypothetical protein
MATADLNRMETSIDNRMETSVDNRNIDNVMSVPTFYSQFIAESYHEIESRSNDLSYLGYQVVSVTPILSGKFVVLGKK